MGTPPNLDTTARIFVPLLTDFDVIPQEFLDMPKILGDSGRLFNNNKFWKEPKIHTIGNIFSLITSLNRSNRSEAGRNHTVIRRSPFEAAGEEQAFTGAEILATSRFAGLPDTLIR